jgi:3'-5' exoribonuclease
MPRPAPPVVPLSQLKVGILVDTFGRLIEKYHLLARDGRGYFKLKFTDRKRNIEAIVWDDGSLFDELEKEYPLHTVCRLRGGLGSHPKYGEQFEIHDLRPADTEADKADGYNPADFFDRSRHDSTQLFEQLRTFAEAELRDPGLKQLVLFLFDEHRNVLQKLPASHGRYYPFAGGWLEHVWNVARRSAWLCDSYAADYPDYAPVPNRDLVVAGALLHEIGRVHELIPPEYDEPAQKTVRGELLGHIALGRDMVRDAALTIENLNPELFQLLEHVLMTYLTLPEWGSPRLPAIPEVLILHHADDLDAKFEMYTRCLRRDTADGPFTNRDSVLNRPLLKARTV